MGLCKQLYTEICARKYVHVEYLRQYGGCGLVNGIGVNLVDKLDRERERESGRPVDDMNVVKMSHFSGLKKSGPT